jgi:DNA polymerase-3 subunit alpha
VELLCAILTSDKDRIDKVVRTIADARSMGVTVLPPDVNESETDFKVVYTHPLGDKFQSGKPPKSERVKDPFGPQIRFGLGAVRGLGESALEALFEARKEGGPFHDLFDLASRVDAKRVNKGVFEALVTCGALDTTLEKQDMSRARAFASIDTALERSRAASRDRERGQTNLFGLLDAGATAAVSVHSASFADAPPWDQRETLVREKQSLGFYVSGHPLDRYMKGESTLAKMGALPISELAQQADWSVVRVVGVAEGYRERIFKDGGGKIAFCDLEDLSGRVALKLRQNHIDQFGALLQAGEPVLVTAKVSFPRKDDDDDSDDSGPREPTLLPTEVVPLSDAIRADARTVVVRVREGNLPSDAFERMAALFGSAPGEVPVHLHIALRSGAEAHLALPRTSKIRVGDDVLSGLERIFGEQVAELR